MCSSRTIRRNQFTNINKFINDILALWNNVEEETTNTNITKIELEMHGPEEEHVKSGAPEK